MEKINLSYDVLKEILSLCNLQTLDSLDVLIKNVSNYDLKDFNSAFNYAYNKEWDKRKEEFEGMDEYDYLTKVHRFKILGMIDVIDAFNQNELNCFKNLIINSIKNIEEKDCAEKEILPSLEEALDRINNCLSDLPSLSYGLNDDELKVLFNKYDVEELELFDTIFKYVYNYDLGHISKIKNDIQRIKEKACLKKVTKLKKSNDGVLSLYYKNPILSKNELRFLEEILEEADYNVLREDINSKIFFEISNLHESVFEELDRRKTKRYKK